VNKPSVYAVMKASIEIQVQPSSAGETFDEMFKAAKREAEDKLRRLLSDGVRVVGQVEFSHAIVK
jgi:hypothetical protein